MEVDIGVDFFYISSNTVNIKGISINITNEITIISILGVVSTDGEIWDLILSNGNSVNILLEDSMQSIMNQRKLFFDINEAKVELGKMGVTAIVLLKKRLSLLEKNAQEAMDIIEIYPEYGV